jgi:DNA-binding GntR family transcriptional regulator
VAVVGATQVIRAQAADLQVSRRLHLPLGAPVLYVERLVYGEQQVPIELVQTWYQGDLYEYTVQFGFADGKLQLPKMPADC